MTLQPGLEPGVAAERQDAGREDDPQSVKKLASKSPTQIALQRLRKDKVAVICGSILLLLVLAALAAPLISKALGIYPEISSPGRPEPGRVAGPVRLPGGGPALLRVHLGPPAGHRSPDRRATTWPTCSTGCGPR